MAAHEIPRVERGIHHVGAVLPERGAPVPPGATRRKSLAPRDARRRAVADAMAPFEKTSARRMMNHTLRRSVRRGKTRRPRRVFANPRRDAGRAPAIFRGNPVRRAQTFGQVGESPRLAGANPSGIHWPNSSTSNFGSSTASPGDACAKRDRSGVPAAAPPTGSRIVTPIAST